jgi:hypothetical protein
MDPRTHQIVAGDLPCETLAATDMTNMLDGFRDL